MDSVGSIELNPIYSTFYNPIFIHTYTTIRHMKIVIFQPMLKQYRVPLFEQMGQLLVERGHNLRVVCGSPPPHELNKSDNVVANGRFWVVEKSRWFFNGKLHYLPHALRHIYWADFVITEQANKHIHNYMLIVSRMFGWKHFAYWGHGQNRQGDSDSRREKLKKKLAIHCDWWFAYTQGVARYMAGLGYPQAKITVLNNSIDTSEFKQLLAEQTPENLLHFKQRWKIDRNARIGLFCGSLYQDKNLEFLLNAAVKIREKNPDFILLVIGAGRDRAIVEDFAARYSFIKYLGPLFGAEKALAFKAAEFFLCPGLVGLAILDAFSAALPLITCDIPLHSPEIEYLEQGFNGLMTAPNENEYAQAVADLLGAPEKLGELRYNARISSDRYSIENMANRFVEGIQHYTASLSG